MMDIGLLIRESRERKNMSREAISDLLGVHVNTYAKIENGEREPDRRELEIICEVLDLNPALFFKNARSSYFNNGDNSPSVQQGDGNTLYIMDKELMESFIRLVDKLSDKLDKE